MRPTTSHRGIPLEPLESRLFLSAYPGIPDDLLTANGYYITNGSGYRITSIEQLVNEFAPVLKMDGGNVHTEDVVQAEIPILPVQLHEIANAMEHQPERYHPKEVEIVTGHLDSDPYANPNIVRDDTVLSPLLQIGDMGDFYRPATQTSAGDTDVYIDLPGGTIDAINANYDQLKDRYQDAIYATVAVDPATGVLEVQYWFFYYGNDFWDIHEGDWEGAMLFFDKVGPYQAHYFQHNGGESRSWNEVEKATVGWQTCGTHPVVYVAANSHASYFEAGRELINGMWDYEYGDGDVLRPGYEMDVRVMPRVQADDLSTDLGDIDGRDMNWLRFQGSWGQPELEGGVIGLGGPWGPGMFRDKFAHPFQYAQTPPVRPPADLQGQGLSTMTPSPGASVDLTYYIRNTGGWPAKNFRASFYVSDNNVITTAGADLPIGWRTIEILGPDEWRTEPITLPLPAFPTCFGFDNEYWIGMVADSTGIVPESSEGNNSNLGEGVDMLAVQAERNLNSRADGTVIAQPLGVNDYGSLAFAGSIGGDEWIGARDIDVYSKDITAGQTWSFDLDRASGNVDLCLRVYNPLWALVASNDNATMPGETAFNGLDSFLTYTATQSATYYLVVSSKENASADPKQLTGRAIGGQGDYTLTVFPGTTELRGAGLSVVPATVAADGHVQVNYTVENAGFAPSGSFNVRFYVKDGWSFDPVADTPTAVVSIANVPGVSTVSGTVMIDLAEPDVFLTDNEYVVHMWVNPPVTVSPVTYAVQEFDTNNDYGRGEGLDQAAFSSERDLGRIWPEGDLLAQPVAMDSTVNGAIGDEWIGAFDLDAYKVTVAAGQTVALDLDRIGGSLNSFIRLYEMQSGGSALNLLASNDNAASPGDAAFNGVDSYLSHTFTQAGDYYVVVGAVQNSGGDPLSFAGRTAGSTGTYTLNVMLLRPDLAVTSFQLNGQELHWGRQGAWTSLDIINSGSGAAGEFNIAIYLSDAVGSVPAGSSPIWQETVYAATLPNGCLLAGETYSVMPHPLLPESDPFRTDNQYWLTVVLDPDHVLADVNVANNAAQATAPLLSEKDLPNPAGTTWVATTTTIGSTAGGSIGGDEWIGPCDIDTWRFDVTTPGVLGINLDRVSGDLDSYIRLYDSTGRLLASNDNAAAPGETASGDSYILRSFAAGTYYIVVGSVANKSANPKSLSGRQAGTTGQYNLTIAPPQPDLYGTGLDATAVTPDGKTTISYSLRNGGIAAAAAVHVRFYLSDDNVFSLGGSGDWLLKTVDIATFSAGVSSSGSFEAQVPYPDIMRTDNQYWLGMVIEAASDIDPTNNLNLGSGIDMASVRSETSLPSPADGTHTAARRIKFEAPVQGDIGGDEWIGAYDIDLFYFHATAGETFGLDVDGTSGTLNSYLRLYDSSWTLVAANDNRQAPDDAAAGLDSFIRFTPPADETYYIVVSDIANAGADPRSITGRASGETGRYSLTLSPDMPDLAGGGFSMDPSTPLVFGGAVNVDIAIVNHGLRTTETAFRVDFYLSDDDTIDPDTDTPCGTVVVSDPVPSGANWSHSIELRLPASDAFRTDNQYYLGMVIDSRADVEEWDEKNNANDGVDKDECTFRSEDSLPSPSDGGIDSPLLSGETYLAGGIGDEWIGDRDMDVFTFVAAAGQTFGFDFDRTSGTLDPYLRLYDSSWDLLAGNHDDQAPGEPPGTGSYIEYAFAAVGRYYVVLSDAANSGADPRGLPGRAGGATGDYTLQVLQIAPDLTAGGTSPTGPLTWGQKIQFAPSVLNEGLLPSTPVQVRFYISADSTISDADYCLGSRSISSLAAGADSAGPAMLMLPNLPPPGFTSDDTIYVGMLVDPQGAAFESDKSNNSWASSGLTVEAPAFPFDAKHPYTLTDLDGDIVTLSLHGPGSGTVVLVQPQPSNIARIVLSGTTLASTLKISVRKAGAGTGETSIGDITVNGDLRGLSAPKADVGGDIFVDGTVKSVVMDDASGNRMFRIGAAAAAGATTSLKFDEPADLTIDSLTGIKSLTAARILDTGGAVDRISAPWLETLKLTGKKGVAGDLAAGLYLTGTGLPARKTTLGKVSVKGSITGGQWYVFGTAGSISVGTSAAAWHAWFGGPVLKLTSTGDLSGDLIADSFASVKVGKSLLNAHVKGQNSPGATAPAIGTLTVKEWIDHSHVETNGNVGMVTAGGDAILKRLRRHRIELRVRQQR